ncbi:KOW motif-containing protein [Nonomuraea sp. NPDC049141]|uniref:KOW motif-containing protein n=1 Tax=Nonomuraea sp. NPDC049141 TaxID=3155500 RepID=UPI0033E00883
MGPDVRGDLYHAGPETVRGDRGPTVERQFVRIVDGPFAGFDAELVSVDGDRLTARVTVFGRQTAVELHRDQIEHPEDIPALWSSEAEADGEVLAGLRERIAAQYDDLGYGEKFEFFLERVDLPEEDLAQEWDAYTALCAEVDARAQRHKVVALRAFDQEIAPLPAREARRRVAADSGRWLPAAAAREERRSRYPAIDRSNAEERLLATTFGHPDPPPTLWERAHRRRAASRSAADLRNYAVWKAANRPQEQNEQARSAAVAQAEHERAAIEERVARDWGFRLPDSIFRFRAFLLSLGPTEKQALDELELSPFGIMDLFDDPARSSRAGIDVRVHGRYYRDPPEFLTFMHGGTDGLHFGLWYDDGRTCTGVASYYNNDGGGVGLPSRTPLGAVRHTLEWGWRHLGDWDDEPADPMSLALVARRHRLRLLREVLMTFETGDREEQGEDYHDAYKDSPELLEYGDPDRIETLDGGGALVDGDTASERGRQRPWNDYDFCTALQKELTEDPAAREARVTEARRRCAAGHPADALALGRDLHWISAGNPGLERHANELLTMAYRALGRDNLAAIAQAHHRHRSLPQVHVLEET